MSVMITKIFKITTTILLLSVGNSAFLQDSTAHLYFDGVNDYVETQNTRMNAINDDFTFEAIIKGNEAEQGVNPTIISNRWSHIKGASVYLKGSGGGPRALCFSNRGEEWYIPNNGSVGSLLDGECHHVAITRNDGDIYFYADGVLFGYIFDPTCVNGLQGFSTIWIGRDHHYGNEFKGVIGNVRVWATVRTEAQIADNMYGSMMPFTYGLEGCWELNEESDQEVFDTDIYAWIGFLGSNDLDAGDYNDPDWFAGDYCADIADYGTGDDDGWVDEDEDDDDEEEEEEEEDNGEGMLFGISGGLETSGLDNVDFEAALTIYPNPVSEGAVTIDFGTEISDVSIRLTDLNGQEVMTDLVTKKTGMVQLNVDALAAGVYFVMINHASGAYATKLIVK